MTHASDSGDLAYRAGSVSNVFRGPEGEAEYAGKSVLIWSRIDGERVIVLYAVGSAQTAEPR